MTHSQLSPRVARLFLWFFKEQALQIQEDIQGSARRLSEAEELLRRAEELDPASKFCTQVRDLVTWTKKIRQEQEAQLVEVQNSIDSTKEWLDKAKPKS